MCWIQHTDVLGLTKNMLKNVEISLKIADFPWKNLSISPFWVDMVAVKKNWVGPVTFSWGENHPVCYCLHRSFIPPLTEGT